MHFKTVLFRQKLHILMQEKRTKVVQLTISFI